MVYIYHAPGNAASFGQTEVSKMTSKMAAATQNRHLEYLSFPEGRNITSACSKIGTRTVVHHIIGNKMKLNREIQVHPLLQDHNMIINTFVVYARLTDQFSGQCRAIDRFLLSSYICLMCSAV